MAAVSAAYSSTSKTVPGRPTADPTTWPTWTGQHLSYLSQQPSPLGMQSIWMTAQATHRSVTSPRESSQVAPVLAYFPPSAAPLPKTLHGLAAQKSNTPSPSLCAVSGSAINISTPGGDDTLVAVPDKRRITGLFGALSGLFVEVVATTSGSHVEHFYLSRLFEEMVPLRFPSPGHRLVHVSKDLPLLISRDGSSVAVWSYKEVKKAKPVKKGDAFDMDGGKEEDPISAFVRAATETAIAQGGVAVSVDDEPLLRPLDLHLNLVFTMPIRVSGRVDVFLAHDLRGRLVLCICTGGELTGLSFSVKDMDVRDVAPSFCIRSVSSAGAVLAVRRHQRCLDILVRHVSGAMSLFMGRNRLCSVELEACPDIDRAKSSPGGLFVTDFVGSQFCLEDDDGFSVRYSLSSATFSSPLVNACLNAISFTLERAGAMLRMTTIFHDILTVCAMRSSVKAHDSRDPDWDALEWALRQSCSDLHQSLEQSMHEPMDVDNDTERGKHQVASEEDWHALLESDYHKHRSRSRTLGSVPFHANGTVHRKSERIGIKNRDLEVLRHILHAVHLLYEDQKLLAISQDSAQRLAVLCDRLANTIGISSFIDHYRRDGNCIGDVSQSIGMYLPAAADDVQVPALLNYLCAVVRGESSHLAPYPLMDPESLPHTQYPELMASWRAKSPAELSVRVLRYYECLYEPSDGTRTYEEKAEAVLLAMVDDGFSRINLEALPFGVALALQDALMTCRQKPKRSWPYRAFVLIGREDCFDFGTLEKKGETLVSTDAKLVNEHHAFLQIQSAAAFSSQRLESRMADTDGLMKISRQLERQNKSNLEAADGCEMQARLFHLRFSSDRRADEVRRILRSTDPIVMTPPMNPGIDPNFEFDIGAEQKRKLDFLMRKRFASPVGRGAFTLRTFVPSDPTKPLAVPEISMTGVVFAQKGSKVTPNDIERVELQWGDFHNGAAAGLRIAASGEDKDGEAGQILTRSWIVNHRPGDECAISQHAGMLLALGLGGYLPALRTTDYYEYLVPRHDLTSIGLMLGLAAGNLGSKHEKVTKMLCVHIKFFNGLGFAVPDFHVSIHVQTAAILGLGLLHNGSCEHLIMDGLFAELMRRPRPGDNVEGREGLALAAGIAIGLVCLGNGSSAFDAADKRRVDRLLQLANGGSGEISVPVSTSPENAAVKPEVANQERSAAGNADSESSRVKEGEFVNSDVVSPGALLALALIYLKTNDERIAKRIIVPGTLFALDRARPDHVFLRVLARALILWDDISCSHHWIRKILPVLLRPEENGTESKGLDILGKIVVCRGRPEHDIDVPGIIQARAFAIAGACTAIALKYAGTNDSTAVSLLFAQCVSFEEALLKQEGDEESTSWCFLTCLCSTALAISVVAAGTGNLDVFRLLRRLRKRRGQHIRSGRYGYHLAMHLAIGFLFLGGGCQTFGTSNVGIAALLCAIYPRFPEDIGDNQFHLQALRHLYVLAVEPRYIEARDVDTGIPCCVDVSIRLANGSHLKSKAPCIVPEAGSIREISVVSERYWPISVPINSPIQGKGWYSGTKGQVIFVKRRTGHLPYSTDPKGSKGILARSICRPRPMTEGLETYFSQVDHLVRVFSADADILAFVRYFCSPTGLCGTQGDSRTYANARVKRNFEMLYECLSNDKSEAVRIYMNLELAANAVRNGEADPSTVGSLMIVSTYVQAANRAQMPLVQPGYVSKLLLSVHEALNYSELHRALLKYVWSNGRIWPMTEGRRDEKRCVDSDLGVTLRLHQIPYTSSLGDLSSGLRQAVSNTSTSTEYWPHFCSTPPSGIREDAVECVLNSLEVDGLRGEENHC